MDLLNVKDMHDAMQRLAARTVSPKHTRLLSVHVGNVERDTPLLFMHTLYVVTSLLLLAWL